MENCHNTYNFQKNHEVKLSGSDFQKVLSDVSTQLFDKILAELQTES